MPTVENRPTHQAVNATISGAKRASDNHKILVLIRLTQGVPGRGTLRCTADQTQSIRVMTQEDRISNVPRPLQLGAHVTISVAFPNRIALILTTNG